MTKIKKVNILSAAKLLATFGALIGLILGILYSFGGLIIDAGVSFGWFTSDETPGLSYGTVLAFGALIGMPAIFGVAGLVTGAVGGFLYNVAAKFAGGVEVELEK